MSALWVMTGIGFFFTGALSLLLSLPAADRQHGAFRVGRVQSLALKGLPLVFVVMAVMAETPDDPDRGMGLFFASFFVLPFAAGSWGATCLLWRRWRNRQPTESDSIGLSPNRQQTAIWAFGKMGVGQCHVSLPT